MDEKFIRERITQLRLAANKSEREMSFDLGHSGSYINSITSGRAIPSLGEFLYICEYFHITPQQFFADDRPLSDAKRRIIAQIEQMDETSAALLSQLLDRLKADKQES